MVIISGASDKHAWYNGRAVVLRTLHSSDAVYMVSLVHISRLVQIPSDWISFFSEHHRLLDWDRLRRLPDVSQSVIEMLRGVALVPFESCTAQHLDKASSLTFQELRQRTHRSIFAVHPADAEEASSTRLLALSVPGDGSKIFAVRHDDLIDLMHVCSDRVGEKTGREVKLFFCPGKPVRSEMIFRWEQPFVSKVHQTLSLQQSIRKVALGASTLPTITEYSEGYQDDRLGCIVHVV